jgi:hypothetical protein
MRMDEKGQRIEGVVKRDAEPNQKLKPEAELKLSFI